VVAARCGRRRQLRPRSRTGRRRACLSSAHFYSSFENFIGVLLFFLVPWSAINLVDYYLVKHGRYDMQSFFKPDGIYGGSSGGRAFATSLPSRYR
jgi:purine-cytosine permease-like protein